MRVAIVLVLCAIHAAGGVSIETGRKVLQASEVTTQGGSEGTIDSGPVEGVFQQLPPPRNPLNPPTSNNAIDQSQSPVMEATQPAPDAASVGVGDGGDTQVVVEGGGQPSNNTNNSLQGDDEGVTTDTGSAENRAVPVDQALEGDESGNVEEGPLESTQESTADNAPDVSAVAVAGPNPDADPVLLAPIPEAAPGSEPSEQNKRARLPAGELPDSSPTTMDPDEPQDGPKQGAAGCNPFDLWNVVEDGKADKVKDLVSSCPGVLENQSKLEVDGEQWGTVLHASVVFEHLDVVKALLDAGSNVNAVTTDGWTPLHLAAAFGQAEISRELLDRGADENALDSSQQIPLHDACSGGYVELTQLLVDRGSNVNQGNEFEETPLIAAAIKDNPEIVKILLKGGADINQRDNEGQTALIEAAIYGSEKALQILLQNGADKGVVDKEGRTASSSACYCLNYAGDEDFLDCDQSQCGEDVKGRVVAALLVSVFSINHAALLKWNVEGARQ